MYCAVIVACRAFQKAVLTVFCRLKAGIFAYVYQGLLYVHQILAGLPL